MASAGGLDAIGDFRHLLVCMICLDRLNVPRTLPCLHTFCTGCLQSHVDNALAPSGGGQSEARHFPCPACRERVELPPEGVHGFRRDFRVEQIGDILAKNEISNNGDDDDDHFRCGVCLSDCDASSTRCRDCRKSFCGACARLHDRIPVFYGHSAERLRPEMKNSRLEECRLHSSDKLSYLCEDCTKFVCSTCVIKDHVDHVVVEKEQGVKDLLRRVDFQRTTVLTRRDQMTSVLERIRDQMKQLDLTRSSLEIQMKAKIAEVIEQIYSQESDLLQELESRVGEEKSRLRSAEDHVATLIDRMSTTAARADDVKDPESEAPPIEIYAELERDLTDAVEESLLVDLSAPSLEFRFIPGRFRPKLGRLSVRVGQGSARYDGPTAGPADWDSSGSDLDTPPGGKSSGARWGALAAIGRQFRPPSISLTLKFGRRGDSGGEFDLPRDVCFLSDGRHFAVCDTNNERIQVFDERGLLVRIIGDRDVRPWGAAPAYGSGHVLVADNADKCVKVYEEGGRLVRKIGSFLCPCACAATGDGHVIVVDFFSSCYDVIDRAGELRARVRYRAGDGEHACGAARLAVTSRDDVIISDVSNASLKAYDRRGRHLWTIADHAQLVAPHGVCVTDDDVILVGDCVTHRIVRFSIEGEFLGAIRSPEGRIKEPTSLAVSRENTLLIGRMNANQIRLYQIMP